ncbi:MAG TPA: hypothetical protein VJU16_08790 [Planctomycetota bacterium]|nr:hypothetical protein [Planctomycetota bacterium]
MRLLLAAVLLVQAATPQSEADKLEAALKKFGNRSYRIKDGGKEVGTLTVKTRIEKAGDRKVAVLEDEYAVKFDGVDTTMSYRETASLEGLRLVSGHHKIVTPGGPVECKIVIKDGKARLQDGGENPILDISPTMVGELAVLRLVCAAEQKRGANFKADLLSLGVPAFEPGHAFRCIGPEQIQVAGKKVDVFRWEQKGEWKHKVTVDGQETTLTFVMDKSYWVSPDGYLVRLRFNSLETTIETK